MTAKDCILLLAVILLASSRSEPLAAQEGIDNDFFTLEKISKNDREWEDRDKISFTQIPVDMGRNFRGLFTNNNLIPIILHMTAGPGEAGITASYAW